MTSTSPRPEAEPSPEDRQRLEDADRRLHEVVESYQHLVNRDNEPGRTMADAQAEVEAAEDELWRLREELLGWARPSWAPRAALVADWFSNEDAVYDDVNAGASQQ